MMDREMMIDEMVSFIDGKIDSFAKMSKSKRATPYNQARVTDAELMLNVAHYAWVWNDVVSQMGTNAKTILGFSGERPDGNRISVTDG